MASFKRVAILGANGALAAPTLAALAKFPEIDVTVLSRGGTSPVEGVKAVKVDYDDEESLVRAFEGVDAVVSLLGGPVIKSQIKAIDAAIRAGVKRFLPSEYGIDTRHPGSKEIVFLGAKVEVSDYLKSKEAEISHTLVLTGPFLDWGLDHSFLGIDAAKRTATLYDGGAVPFTATTLADVGVAVAGVLTHPAETENKAVRVASTRTTSAAWLAEFEKQLGAFEVTNESGDAAWEASGKLIESGEFLTGAYLQLRLSVLTKGLSDFETNDDALLGVEEKPIGDHVKEYIRSRNLAA